MTVALADRVVSDARHRLHVALDLGIGKKALVLAKAVSGIVSRLADSAFLKEHGFERIVYLSPSVADVLDCTSIAYLTRPDPSAVAQIADHVCALVDAAGSPSAADAEKRFYLFCLPRATLLCRQILEDRGILANVEVHDVEVEFVPLESDLLSLEMPSLRAMTVASDYSALHHLALAVLALETGIGTFSCVRGRGTLAQTFVDMYMSLADAFPQARPAAHGGALILVDRTLDLVTPLMTQLTYAGVLDVFRDVQCGFVDVEVPGAPGRTRKFKLSKGDDRIYAELADLNFSCVAPTLQRLAVELRARADERHAADTITAIHAFVDRLPEIQKMQEALPIHIGLAESVNRRMDQDFYRALEAEQGIVAGGEYDPDLIEELILRNHDVHAVLALICLASQAGSVKDRQLDAWRREIVQSYGHQYLAAWSRLEAAGLLLRPGTRPRAGAPWAALRKGLGLLVEGVREADPDHIAYAFSGYAPLSVRIVQELLHAPREDALQRVLPAPSVEWGRMEHGGPVYVAFLGGVTMAEVSALRLVSKLSRVPVTVLTTETLTAKGIFSSFA